jgi:superfamily II DNA helicase RecQ
MQNVKLLADEARRAGRKLWEEACTKFTMVLLLLEELKSKEFSNLLDSNKFYGCIFALGVDEVHLLYFWGATFWTKFCQIRFVQARIPCHANRNTPIIAMMATLCAGAPMESVCQTLALHDGKYHFIRRSNVHHDIRIIFRHMRSGMKSVNFPELDWVLTDGQQIIIFCATIALGFCIATYLWHLAELIRFNN